jgi:hypothetical protein
MSYTIEDFKRDVFRKRFLKMSPEERRELLEELPPEEQQALALTLPPEARLAGLSEE